MATINASFQFDMQSLNLNRLSAGTYDFWDNEYAAYGNKVYQDVFSFNYAAYRYGIFGGTGFAVDLFNRVSGTVQGYAELYGQSTLFTVENFSYSAAAMLKAIYSPSTVDDFAIFRAILAGADKFYLSSGNDRAHGYGGNDMINGGLGDDWLFGGAGNDTLRGGEGKDVYIFDADLNGKTNVDTVVFYSAVYDTIALENSIFTKLKKTGDLNPGNFASNSAGVAKDATDYIVYETDTGKLFYDADGNGKGAAILFAQLSNKPVLAASDFLVI